jgi:hypothetical protein
MYIMFACSPSLSQLPEPGDYDAIGLFYTIVLAKSRVSVPGKM